MIGYIYKTTNNIDGKIYVGMHRVADNKFDEKYLGSGKHLKYAINKYGEENFSCEIIEWCETEEKLCEREIFWIRELNAMDKSIGYNMKEGGIGGWNIDVAGVNNPMYGVHRYGSDNPNYRNTRSAESRAKQSASIAKNGGHHGERNPMYGRKHSKEAREKMSKVHKGQPGILLGRKGKDHPSFGLHWWCDGVNPPVKSKEQPTPYHHLGRK